MCFWAYEGWNNLGFLGGEVLNPQRTIPKALTLGVGIVTTVYVLANAAYLYVLPVSELAAVSRQENAIAAVAVVQSFLGPAAIGLILGLIITSTFSSTNNSVMTSSRVYYAMALDGLFFPKAGKCNAQGVPANALLIQGIWSSLLVLSGTFDQLTDMLVFAAFIFYGMGALGVFVLRRKMPDAVRSFKVPFYPVLPGLFVLFCIVLVGNSLLERPTESGIGLALMATGVPLYFVWNKRKR